MLADGLTLADVVTWTDGETTLKEATRLAELATPGRSRDHDHHRPRREPALRRPHPGRLHRGGRAHRRLARGRLRVDPRHQPPDRPLPHPRTRPPTGSSATSRASATCSPRRSSSSAAASRRRWRRSTSTTTAETRPSPSRTPSPCSARAARKAADLGQLLEDAQAAISEQGYHADPDADGRPAAARDLVTDDGRRHDRPPAPPALRGRLLKAAVVVPDLIISGLHRGSCCSRPSRTDVAVGFLAGLLVVVDRRGVRPRRGRWPSGSSTPPAVRPPSRPDGSRAAARGRRPERTRGPPGPGRSRRRARRLLPDATT